MPGLLAKALGISGPPSAGPRARLEVCSSELASTDDELAKSPALRSILAGEVGRVAHDPLMPPSVRSSLSRWPSLTCPVIMTDWPKFVVSVVPSLGVV